MACRNHFQVQVFGLWQLATNMAAAGSKVRDYWLYSGDVGSGVAKCDQQSIWNPQKNCGSFVDAVVGILTNKANISI